MLHYTGNKFTSLVIYWNKSLIKVMAGFMKSREEKLCRIIYKLTNLPTIEIKQRCHALNNINLMLSQLLFLYDAGIVKAFVKH